ncbi:MAG: ABC transporter permease [Dehalococcoidia bacterium]|uniref:ABC transporter permease n=1 Tax=Candidatus Amarobacter glycogenicus TaxID=3140699 RepID=UPI001D27BC0E|nr:ABC transporter permease [Dehalococcoidia bacterium]MBK7726310.1 ABC transporter permease [Dehalococcoidia bacterium]
MTQTQQPAALPAAGYTDFRRRRSVGSTLRRAGALARRNKLGAVGVILVFLILFVAIFSPLIKRYDDTESFQTANPDFNPTANPFEIAANPGLASPYILDRWESPLGSDHWLGTDQFGRDIYSRIVVGARLAVLIGVGASLIAVISGSIVGLVSGYFGGKIDLVIQRFVDAIQAFPGLVLLMLIVSIMDRPSLTLMIVALGFLGFATSVRIVRSSVLGVSQAAFVEAARSYGATDIRIMLQHVLPNILAPILVVFSISIGAYILAEASLSFLGLGPADKTTWGKMVNAGRVALDLHPWESVISGAAITLAVLGFNLAGDAIRDELDPRLRGR